MIGCPECEPGDVEVRGPGDASCALCRGGFVTFAQALPALSMSDVDVQGRAADDEHACPACKTPFRPFALGGETFHACVGCRALWAAPAAVDRASSMVARARAAAASSKLNDASSSIKTAAPSSSKLTDPSSSIRTATPSSKLNDPSSTIRTAGSSKLNDPSSTIRTA